MSSSLKVLKEAALFRFRQKFTHLILHVTNICNFRCQHCFVDFKVKPKDLTLDEIKQISGVINGLIWLDIGGGEPFVRDDLYKIIGCFNAKEISIPTNGWFIDKMISQIKKIDGVIDIKKLILTISIDGLPKTHDMIRKKRGSFERLKLCFFKIHSLFPNLRIKINTVLNDINFTEIIPLMKLVKNDFQPDYHSILFLRGSPINPDLKLPSVEKIRELEDDIFKIQQDYSYGRKGLARRIQRNYQSIKREIANEILDKKTQVIPCLGGQVHLVVYADGNVAPCELLPAVGSLRKRSFDSILKSQEWADAVDRIKAKECFCTHDCNMVENILYNFKLYPKIFLENQKTP